jgi:hypothetical protein
VSYPSLLWKLCRTRSKFNSVGRQKGLFVLNFLKDVKLYFVSCCKIQCTMWPKHMIRLMAFCISVYGVCQSSQNTDTSECKEQNQQRGVIWSIVSSHV